jgi:hypothetical protein
MKSRSYGATNHLLNYFYRQVAPTELMKPLLLVSANPVCY